MNVMKIAIRGHKDRGAEVIKILEQLGGRNNDCFFGTDVKNIYFINDDNEIDCDRDCTQYQVYTLDEYLESLNQTEPIKSTNMEKVIEQKNDNTQRQLSVEDNSGAQFK